MRPKYINCLSLVMVILGLEVFAQTPFRYFYDDTNQLFRVLDSTGTLIEYVYDAVGNPSQILRSTVPPGTLAILNFTPRQAAPGTTITIYGQAFNTTPSANTVLFNGIPATVVTATSTQLTVVVPPGASTGQISVTVGGQTVNSGTLVFKGVQPPSLSSLIPDGGITGSFLNLTVNGANLDNATFTTNPSGGLTFNATTTSTSANGLANVTGAVGVYALIATTPGGSTSSTLGPNNRFVVLDTSGEADLLITIQNRAAPPAGFIDPSTVSNEAQSSKVSVVNSAPPPAGTSDPSTVSNEAISRTVAVLNSAPPAPGTPDPSLVSNEGDSSVTTVANQTGASALFVTAAARARERAERDRQPVLYADDELGTEPSALAGQQLHVSIALPSGLAASEAEIRVNGVSFATASRSSLETTFLAPAGVASLDIQAIVRQTSGVDAAVEPLRIAIHPDSGTIVRGRVTTETGQPLTNLPVRIEAHGLLAEYYDFDRPLSSIPDLSDRTPIMISAILGLDLLNPHAVFGLDPLGLGLAPDYAARFRGEIRIDRAGSYTFFLRSHSGSRLRIGGKNIVEVPPGLADTQEATASVPLQTGWHAIEVLYYENVGAPELQVTWAPPGEDRQSIPLGNLELQAPGLNATTSPSGDFSIAGVPLGLGVVQVRVEGPDPVYSAPANPASGTTSVGVIRVKK